MFLKEIFIYPIKSLGGISLTSSTLTTRGLQYDRRWMLIDEKGNFLSQRQLPKLALFNVGLDKTHLSITYVPKVGCSLKVPILEYSKDRTTFVDIWGKTTKVAYMDPKIDQWFSDLLDTPCHLVHMSDQHIRKVNPKYGQPNDIVSLADGYPYLVLSQSALDLLNDKLDSPIEMNRFRANLIVDDVAPHDEDQWQQFSIGEQSFRGIKPCARCQVITIDQSNATKGKEPTKTLATYRKENNAILFGLNAIWDQNEEGQAQLNIGDKIIVKQRK